MAKTTQLVSKYKGGEYRIEQRKDGDFYFVPPTPPELIEQHPEGFKSLSGIGTVVVGRRTSGVRFWQPVEGPKVERTVARGGAAGGGKTASVTGPGEVVRLTSSTTVERNVGKRRSSSTDNDAAATRERRAHRASPVKARATIFKRYKDQSGLEPEQVRWACSVGLHHFVVNGTATPTECPDGHSDAASAAILADTSESIEELIEAPSAASESEADND